MTECKAIIESIYHGSCVDGEGLRCVVFFSGCNLRCPFCHNPETLYTKGKSCSVSEVFSDVIRYKNYIKKGGVTLSGGEPFLQSEFCTCLTKKFHDEGIKVICETNGLIINEELISTLDGVRLDIKNQTGEDELALINRYERFISLCSDYGVKVTCTNVLCPGINDTNKSLKSLGKFLNYFNLKDGFELLPFKKMCVEKYEKLGIEFPYNFVPEATDSSIKKALKIIDF